MFNKDYKIGNVEDIKRFILAGKSIFTIESTRTGRWFTYQVKKRVFKVKDGSENIMYFVSVLTGSDNENSYTYLGVINTKFYVTTTKNSKISNNALSYKALNFFTSLLRNDKMHDEINFYHKGICGKCGKALTTPDSVKIGLGPVCRGYDNPTISVKRKKKIQNLNRKLMKK